MATKPSWVSLSKTSGSGNDNFTITAAKHTGRASRSGTVTVKGTGVSDKEVTVTQAGASVFASFNSGQGAVAQGGGTLTIKGRSNANGLRFEWLANSSAGGATSWNDSNQGSFENGAYPTPGIPTGYTVANIYVKNNVAFTAGKTEVINHPNPTDTEYNTVKVLGEASDYEFSIEISFPENTDDKSVTRKLRVFQSGSSGTELASLTLTQYANSSYLTLNTSSVSLSAGGDSATVSVSSNTSWTVS